MELCFRWLCQPPQPRQVTFEYEKQNVPMHRQVFENQTVMDLLSK